MRGGENTGDGSREPGSGWYAEGEIHHTEGVDSPISCLLYSVFCLLYSVFRLLYSVFRPRSPG